MAIMAALEQCRAQCTEGGYAYMGMACPRADAFECWCCNDLDENSAGRHSLIPTQECSGGELTSGVNGNRHDHCSGFSNAGNGGYILDGWYLGGHCRAAIYEMDPHSATTGTGGDPMCSAPVQTVVGSWRSGWC